MGAPAKLECLVVRGFRNLDDLDCELPAEGVTLLGANGQGKTNLLEALSYPVLFRSVRGAPDQELGRFGGPGFHVEVCASAGTDRTCVVTTYTAAARRKRVTIGGEEIPRLADAVGHCLAVTFLPVDVGLASGPAPERRRYLDRMLALAGRSYLTALTRYRAALAQRNSALRQGRLDVARAFDGALADSGAAVVKRRLEWMAHGADRFAGELDALGESESVCLRYRGHSELAERGAWEPALQAALPRDRARGTTTVGPHRDDLALEIGGRPLRSLGSTGQQRTAAVALKLMEIVTLAEARATQPALLLDDVFAELDRERQARLARRLVELGVTQIFVTAPRRDELPPDMQRPIWHVECGRVRR